MHLNHFRRKFGDDFALQELTASQLQDYLNTRVRRKGKSSMPLSAVTLRKELASLRACFNWAEQTGLLTGRFPNRGLRFPKGADKRPFMTCEDIERRVGRGGLAAHETKRLWDSLFLDLEQIDEFLGFVKSHASRPWVYPMCVATAHTGARRSELARPAVRGTRKVDYRECEGMCLANLSDYWRLLGDLHKSIDCSNQALVIAREKNEPKREIVPLINLGCSYFKLGQIDQALQYLEDALKKAGDEGDQCKQSKALLNLGACWVQLNDLTKAYEHLMRCFEISIKMEDENAIAMTEISLGDLYLRSNDLNRAVDFLEAGIEMAQLFSNLRTEKFAQNKLGIVRERLGQPREAIKHYERELDITKIIGDHCGEGNVLRNLGNA